MLKNQIQNLMITSRSQLFSLMQDKALVITPNNRLSAELIDEFFSSNPKSVQDKPICLPYSAFLTKVFKQLCHQTPKINHPLVLTSQQSRYLWRKVIEKSSIEFLNEGLLTAVEQAWSRCHYWQIDFRQASFSYNLQTLAFSRLAQSFQEELQHRAAISEEQLVSYLISHKNYFQNQKLIWTCFDDYTPQQEALQDYFSEQGCQHYHYDLTGEKARPLVYAAQDNNDEYQQLIFWLKERIALGEKRIAIVVPELENEAPKLKRLLQDELAEPFNISLGQSLATYPLIADALCLLELDEKQFSADQAQLLLNSPYLAFSKTEFLARAQFKEDSKILQELYFPKRSLVNELKVVVPKLADLLNDLVPYPKKDSVQGFTHHFKNRLKALGFPGEYPLNSMSYQCYQRFLALFDEFKQLALLSEEMSASEAYAQFKLLAKATIFQPKNNSSSVQILGLLEVAGSTFDSLWICGLTDLCLPQKTKFSAFIPIALQREKRMPYASLARELELAEKILTRLSLSSQEIIFSYPKLSDDKPNLPSPLIAGFPAFSGYEPSQQAASQPLVDFMEAYEVPFANDEKAAGGSAILANQAKCPFRAFATHRLHAKAALETSEGPNARELGQLVHKVMELVWGELKNQKTLLSLNEEQLAKLIEKAILNALEPIKTQRPYSFSALIQEVEFLKLKKLVQACLNWEKERPPFEVEALEEAFKIHLAGIDFSLRVDRLDKLEDGSKWVIDYKSSLPTSLPWNEERPKEPQLLLYALLDEAIRGLLFAELKGGQLNRKTFCEETLKKDELWSDFRDHWREKLRELAEEFSKGLCQPQPASVSVCQSCDLHNLCRFEHS